MNKAQESAMHVPSKRLHLQKGNYKYLLQDAMLLLFLEDIVPSFMSLSYTFSTMKFFDKNQEFKECSICITYKAYLRHSCFVFIFSAFPNSLSEEYQTGILEKDN